MRFCLPLNILAELEGWIYVCVPICPLLLCLVANISKPTRHLDRNKSERSRGFTFALLSQPHGFVSVFVDVCAHFLDTPFARAHHHHFTPTELNSAAHSHGLTALFLLQSSRVPMTSRTPQWMPEISFIFILTFGINPAQNLLKTNRDKS